MKNSNLLIGAGIATVAAVGAGIGWFLTKDKKSTEQTQPVQTNKPLVATHTATVTVLAESVKANSLTVENTVKLYVESDTILKVEFIENKIQSDDPVVIRADNAIKMQLFSAVANYHMQKFSKLTEEAISSKLTDNEDIKSCFVDLFKGQQVKDLIVTLTVTEI